MRALPRLSLLALATALLMLPALVGPEMRHDSFWIDMVWLEQFTAALRTGDPYPRWLPLSFGGLGAPVFYFYAPLSFHLGGLFGLAGLGTYSALMAAFAAAWLGSGLAMARWLRGAPAPLAGALLYMALPYHVIDFYARGALAEFCAYAVLPLVALGVRVAAERARALPLALAYAALIMTHLPMAVIGGVLLVAPYALWLTRAEPTRSIAVARGVAGGIGGAALYLLPALTLQRHVAMGSLWDVPFLQPVSWSLLHPERWGSASYVLLFAGLAGATALAAAVLAGRRFGFWAGLAIGVAVIVAGLVPGFWSLPVLRQVQFPWRALAVAEFALATVFAQRRGSPVLAAAVLAPLLSFALLMLTPNNPLNGEPIPLLPVRDHQDVVEYLPPDMVAPGRRPRLDLIARAASAGDAMFPFPSLRVRCGGVPGPLPVANGVGRIPAGCPVVVERLPVEWAGLAVSLSVWGCFAAPAFAATLRRGRRDRGRPRPSAIPGSA